MQSYKHFERFTSPIFLYKVNFINSFNFRMRFGAFICIGTRIRTGSRSYEKKKKKTIYNIANQIKCNNLICFVSKKKKIPISYLLPQLKLKFLLISAPMQSLYLFFDLDFRHKRFFRINKNKREEFFIKDQIRKNCSIIKIISII